MKCPTHQKELKLIPQGISKKSGKPYPAFYACPDYGCKFTKPAEPDEDIVYTEPEGEPKEENPQLLILEEIQKLRAELEEKLEAIQQEWAKKLEGIRDAFRSLK